MCGIIGYKGKQKCLPFLFSGLKKLEYRGYDSAGIAVHTEQGILLKKQPGSVEDLGKVCNSMPNATMGIGHTRWATHGSPCARNAHPHITADGRLCLVHNGIIENYETLAQELKEQGYMLISDTDSEVLLYIIYDYLLQGESLLESVRLGLDRVVGAYAIVVMDKNNPDALIVAKNGSPIVIGVGDDEFFVSSDVIGLADYLNKIVYLEDGMIAELTDKISTLNIKHNTISDTVHIQKLNHQWYDIEKGGYDNFMIKEIYEQPKVIADCLSGRLDGYLVKLGGLLGYEHKFSNASSITIVSCGSSWHAALMAKYYIEELCGILVNVEYASEFCYRKIALDINSVVVAISQSGETADTISAIKTAKKYGAFTVGICNVANSTISRITDCGIFLRAGAEIGVASTKAFSNQMLTLLLLALWIEQISKKYNHEYRQAIVEQLYRLPGLIRQTLSLEEKISTLATKFKRMKNCLYLGRGYNFPIALEGALKLKEISYVHAEGYPAAEMKHGPIALIDKNMPVLVVANNHGYWDKMRNNIREIQARGGKIILISSNNYTLDGIDYCIDVMPTLDIMCSFLSVVVLQLFAYHSAVLRDCNVDKPRNLAKSVTVE